MDNNTRRLKPKDYGRRDITLMTLIANDEDSYKLACGLLQKYNQPKPKNHQDLENKLATLYVNSPDKPELEKELAYIHPHKNWLLKNCVEPVKDELPMERNFGQNLQEPNIPPSYPAPNYSNFTDAQKEYRAELKREDKGMVWKDYVVMGMMITLIGTVFFAIHKTKAIG